MFNNIFSILIYHRVWERGFENANKRMDKLVSDIAESEDHDRLKDYGKTFVYKRKKVGWEAFECPCGSPKQLSPEIKNREFYCTQCGRKIKIVLDETLKNESNLSSINIHVHDRNNNICIDEKIKTNIPVDDNFKTNITVDDKIKKEESVGFSQIVLFLISVIAIILVFTIKPVEGAGSFAILIVPMILIFNLILIFTSKKMVVKILSLVVIGFFLIMLLFNIMR